MIRSRTYNRTETTQAGSNNNSKNIRNSHTTNRSLRTGTTTPVVMFSLAVVLYLVWTIIVGWWWWRHPTESTLFPGRLQQEEITRTGNTTNKKDNHFSNHGYNDSNSNYNKTTTTNKNETVVVIHVQSIRALTRLIWPTVQGFCHEIQKAILQQFNNNNTNDINDINDDINIGNGNENENNINEQQSTVSSAWRNWTASSSSSSSSLPSLRELLSSSSSSSSLSILVNVSIRCETLFRESGGGTGNWLLYLYSLRQTARALVVASSTSRTSTTTTTTTTVTLQVHCRDAHPQRSTLVLPWLTGSYNFTTTTSTTRDNNNNNKNKTKMAFLSIEQACTTSYEEMSFSSTMLSTIRYELRRMARALLKGNVAHVADSGHEPHSDRHRRVVDDNEGRLVVLAPNNDNDDSVTETILYQLAVPDDPVFPGIVLDDSIVHFRCGDLVTTGHAGYYFVKFRDVVQHLVRPPQPIMTTTTTTKTSRRQRRIGIVTQPFQKGSGHQVRPRDQVRHSGARCRLLVRALVRSIETACPDSIVTVHNGPNETIALTYARMILADQFVGAAASTFASFPAVAVTGTAYLPRPRSPDNNDKRNPTIRLSASGRALPMFTEPNRWLLHSPHDKDDKGTSSGGKIVWVDYNKTSVMPSKDLIQLWESPKGDQKVLDWFQHDES